MSPDALLGPLAALAGALVVIAYLARILREYIDDIKVKRDEALVGWKVQTDASAILARAEEARSRDLARRRRLADKP